MITFHSVAKSGKETAKTEKELREYHEHNERPDELESIVAKVGAKRVDHGRKY